MLMSALLAKRQSVLGVPAGFKKCEPLGHWQALSIQMTFGYFQVIE